jgi:hypothetical protein
VLNSNTSTVLKQVLRRIERSVLPRTITIRAPDGQLDFDVIGQNAVLCPRSGGAFILSSQLQQEAPDAYEILRSGTLAAGDTAGSLANAREPLLRHWARTLTGFAAGAATVECEVRALSAIETKAGLQLPAFGAFELAKAFEVLPPGRTGEPAPGCVSSFHSQAGDGAEDAWLFRRLGAPASFPAAAGLEDIERMTIVAREAEVWREMLAGLEGPVLCVLRGGPRDDLRCVAVDDTHIALVSKAAPELGPLLSSWRAACADSATLTRH